MNQIQVVEQISSIEVVEQNNVLEITEHIPVVLEVITPGAQGPPGDAARSYKHTQSSPSSTWTITHNLGFYPSVELLNTGSQEIEGDVVHLSQNVTIAYFTTPIAGFARLI